MIFKWDPAKATRNKRKHGVDFHEAASVLDVLVVSHTEEGETVRIISARTAGRRERRFYEEGS